MGLNLDASPEELNLFLEEAEEHLQTLEENLLRLEKENFNEELLQEIFRSAHTLKGSSATIGHNRMAELTHSMENILDKVRKQQLTVTSQLVDILFESLDYLRVLKDEIINDEESDLNIQVMIEKLNSINESGTGETGSEGAAQDTDNSSEVDESGFLGLRPEDKNAIDKAISNGLQPYLIRVSFDVEPEMLAVRAFVTLMSINEMGDVVKSKPTSEEIEQDQVTDTLVCLLATSNNREEIEKRLKDLPGIGEYEISEFDKEALSNGSAETDNTQTQNQRESSDSVPDSKDSKGKVAAGQEKPKTAISAAARSVKKSNRTVRVDVELLDNLMNLVGELVIDRTRLFQILGNLEAVAEMDEVSQEIGRTSVHIARVTTQLQESIMKARMLPVENLFNKFPRMVRDLSHKAGKEVEFIMTGQETELDRSIIEEIGDPLIHLLRNALDHGIELPQDRVAKGKSPKGQLMLQASHEENHIIITIKDDGQGIDPEKIRSNAVRKGLISDEQARRLSDKEAVNLIFLSGLSTASQITDVSGRGVGMDVVRTNIEKINGAIEINSVINQGTEFKIKLPLTLAIIRALLVSIGNAVYAIPLSAVTETIRTKTDQVEYVNNREVIVVRGKVLPLVRMSRVFNRFSDVEENLEKMFVVVVNLAGQQVGLVVDSLVGEQEIVIKSLGKYIGDVQGISGATILGDGNVALIVDVPNLVKKAVS